MVYNMIIGHFQHLYVTNTKNNTGNSKNSSVFKEYKENSQMQYINNIGTKSSQKLTAYLDRIMSTTCI